MFSALVRRTAGVASSSSRRQVSRFSTSTLRMAGAQPPKMIAEVSVCVEMSSDGDMGGRGETQLGVQSFGSTIALPQALPTMHQVLFGCTRLRLL